MINGAKDIEHAQETVKCLFREDFSIKWNLTFLKTPEDSKGDFISYVFITDINMAIESSFSSNC